MHYYFAYEVAKELNISPYDIITKWTCPQLIVTYGHYMNKKSQQNYYSWENSDSGNRGPRPDKYIIEFI